MLKNQSKWRTAVGTSLQDLVVIEYPGTECQAAYEADFSRGVRWLNIGERVVSDGCISVVAGV